MDPFYKLAVYLQLWVVIRIRATISVEMTRVSDNSEVFTSFKKDHEEKCLAWKGTENFYCCGHCSRKLNCKTYASCCLDQYSSFIDGFNTVMNNRYECVRPQYASKGSRKQVRSKSWMIGKCKNNTTENGNIERCHYPGDSDSLDSFIPVTDLATMTHYKNKFCAFCSDVDENAALYMWRLAIYSSQYLRLPDKYLLTKIRQQSGVIIFEPPSFVSRDPCTIPRFKISKCNTTGLWSYYNETLEQACKAFIDPFNLTYQNYYCYLCNSPGPHQYPINLACEPPAVMDPLREITPPFFALLDVGAEVVEEDTEVTLVCKPTQFADHEKMICRDIHCRKNAEGRCDYQQVAELCFSAFLKLTPLGGRKPSLRDIDDWSTLKVLETKVAERFEKLGFTVTQMTIFLASKTPADYIISYLVIFKHRKATLSSLLKLDSSIASLNWKFRITEFRLKFESYNMIRDSRRHYIYVPNEVNYTTEEAVSYYTANLTEEKCNSSKTETALTKLHVCPYIEVELDEISALVKNDLLIIYGVSNGTSNKIVLSKWLYEIHGNKILMCVDTWTNIYRSIPTSNYRKKVLLQVIKAKQIVSFICVCLSIICLIITIITYLKFSVLQTQPGVNTMILCSFLLLAQIVFQFGAGQQSISPWACSVIGAVCHFLWLAVMFSMTTCAFHMFSIFKTTKTIFSRFDLKTTLKSIIRIVSISVFFVLANAMISYFLRNDHSGGYGGSICYISSNLMQIITFIIPAAVSLFVNIFLFLFVVLSISKASSAVQKHSQERNYLLIYARLSTLTGITWIFGFIQIFLPFEIFEYLFIILNASQGVFIMLAFVVNKKVLSVLIPNHK